MPTKEKIITRFPPSPTGYLHIGGVRTALFNWLFARHHKGRFILRIEDTDQVRSSKKAVNAILASLEWLGLDWDEGPYYQSQRRDIHNMTIERLLKSGKAYYCHCSQEEIDKKREEARAKGLKPKYDGTCRNLGLGPAPGSVVRLKIPQTGNTQFNDLIKGHIQFDNAELDDLILRRSDGTPTYHLAVVADDIDLGINYIIRGDDHINNTPRQILIYEALKTSIPQYAHVPLILGPDKTRLSKRHGAVSVLTYKDLGYLPQAIINALARLGWSHGDQEKFTKQELIQKFSLKSVGKSAGIFNSEKLLDLNAWYMRKTSDGDLAASLRPFLEKRGFKDIDENKLKNIVGTLKARSKTLVEMADNCLFYLKDEIEYDPSASERFLVPEILHLFEDLKRRLKGPFRFTQEALENCFVGFLDDNHIELKAIAQPLRVAITGKTASPGIFEVMVVLGRDTVLKRLEKAIQHIKSKKSI